MNSMHEWNRVDEESSRFYFSGRKATSGVGNQNLMWRANSGGLEDATSHAFLYRRRIVVRFGDMNGDEQRPPFHQERKQ
jgi:hypothetical protein